MSRTGDFPVEILFGRIFLRRFTQLLECKIYFSIFRTNICLDYHVTKRVFANIRWDESVRRKFDRWLKRTGYFMRSQCRGKNYWNIAVHFIKIVDSRVRICARFKKSSFNRGWNARGEHKKRKRTRMGRKKQIVGKAINVLPRNNVNMIFSRSFLCMNNLTNLFQIG